MFLLHYINFKDNLSLLAMSGITELDYLNSRTFQNSYKFLNSCVITMLVDTAAAAAAAVVNDADVVTARGDRRVSSD